mmetsp:Transcript_43556/g.75750  ORF Transcript_43556/g.75750 Transcript_43556/m.75750 type:complete len:291 (-) Transcript_43556:1570-2442(-)
MLRGGACEYHFSVAEDKVPRLGRHGVQVLARYQHRSVNRLVATRACGVHHFGLIGTALQIGVGHLGHLNVIGGNHRVIVVQRWCHKHLHVIKVRLCDDADLSCDGHGRRRGVSGDHRDQNPGPTKIFHCTATGFLRGIADRRAGCEGQLGEWKVRHRLVLKLEITRKIGLGQRAELSERHDALAFVGGLLNGDVQVGQKGPINSCLSSFRCQILRASSEYVLRSPFDEHVGVVGGRVADHHDLHLGGRIKRHHQKHLCVRQGRMVIETVIQQRAVRGIAADRQLGQFGGD